MQQVVVKPVSTYSVMGFTASWMLPNYRRISHMTDYSKIEVQTSFTLMMASRVSGAQVTGCEGRDNIGR
jgi:hypothetical protein